MDMQEQLLIAQARQTNLEKRIRELKDEILDAEACFKELENAFERISRDALEHARMARVARTGLKEVRMNGE